MVLPSVDPSERADLVTGTTFPSANPAREVRRIAYTAVGGAPWMFHLHRNRNL